MEESNDLADKNRSNSSNSSSSSSDDGSGIDRLASNSFSPPEDSADEESDLGFGLFDDNSDEASSHSSTVTALQQQDGDDVDEESHEASSASEWAPFFLACQSVDTNNSGRLDVADVQKIFFRLAPIASDDEKKELWRDMDQDLVNLDTSMIEYSELQEYLY